MDGRYKEKEDFIRQLLLLVALRMLVRPRGESKRHASTPMRTHAEQVVTYTGRSLQIPWLTLFFQFMGPIVPGLLCSLE